MKGECGVDEKQSGMHEKDMRLRDAVQVAYGGLLELHQVFTGARVLHLDLTLTFLCGCRCKSARKTIAKFFTATLKFILVPGHTFSLRLSAMVLMAVKSEA